MNYGSRLYWHLLALSVIGPGRIYIPTRVNTSIRVVLPWMLDEWSSLEKISSESYLCTVISSVFQIKMPLNHLGRYRTRVWAKVNWEFILVAAKVFLKCSCLIVFVLLRSIMKQTWFNTKKPLFEINPLGKNLRQEHYLYLCTFTGKSILSQL